MEEVNDSDNDHYVIYGHALPEIDEEGATSKKLKPVPIEEQIVTDENGRRRFHGAFTGGFSAGFFNTAGSRDGWTPKNFKSTRENRFQSNVEQRPEDFMDDDDMGEFGIAPQKLQTSSKFRGQENEKKRKLAPPPSFDQPIPGDPVLEQFIKPAEDTIGVKVLKEMGWKPGQGVGPKLTKKSKKTKSKSTKNLFGPMMRSRHEESSDEEINEQYKDFLFAPDDIPNFVAKPKSNLFGIGYKGLERTDVFGNEHINLFGPEVLKFDNADKAKKGRKMKIAGQAFGVGAYEEDDDDIYQRDDMSRYDFSLDFNSPEDQAKKDPKKRQKSRWGEESIIQCIEGFSISEKSSVLQKKFDPPALPKGFTPKGLRGKKSRFEASKDDVLETTNPTSNQRKMVINSEADKEQFAQQEQEQPPTESEDQIKKFLAENFKEGLDEFKPFNKDPSKQKRYEQYLVCLKNGRKNALRILQPKSMAEWERERERVEFERASLLFKPLNFNMSSRFVSAGTSEEVKDVKVAEKILNESENAVKMKLYGKLTRETVEWHPARLLCLRFNVKSPYGDSSVTGTAPLSKSKFDVFGRLNELPLTDKDKQKLVPTITTETEKKDDVIMDDVVTENDKNDEKVEEKPPLDLFQSIFLASSSSDSEESETDEPKDEKAQGTTKKDIFGTELVKDTTKKPWEEKPENLQRNPNPNRGIFANVDLDRLNEKKDTKKNPVMITAPSSRPSPGSSSGRMSAKDFFSGSDETFGPAKPKEVLKNYETKETSSSDDEDEWVEKSEKKHKKHKKEKKKKSKKKKKKKSKKKHKRRDYSSSSDTDSD